MEYRPGEIEPKWQAIWEKENAFSVPVNLDELKKKPKYYILDMFPYPSGAGLHVGHPEGYTATDVVARMKRQQGFHVLHPMGWDAFGLPAERAAVRENIHPAIITSRNVDNFRRQIKSLGFSYDWNREVSTSSPDYYRWTQWIFLKLYEKGLAYLAEVPVNWCPALGTVLANEEVENGVYVETGDPVERRKMRQWMLRITAYAERLLQDLEEVDWPEGVKDMQKAWIGKSIGAEIRFQVAGTSESFIVFTTRPDTIFGVTYCVLAPEHPLVSSILTPEQRSEADTYIQAAKNRTDLQRTDLARGKTGVWTGAYALHPATGLKLPVYVADYVLMTYGTGAIMAVPGHDERDHEFARKFNLPILEVVSGKNKPIQEEAYTGVGAAVNSQFLDGLETEYAKKKAVAWLEQNQKGQSKVTYRLRDWLFSRQRYWGEPFPIVHSADGEIIPLPEDALPITLPEIDEYRPTETGEPPLARAPQTWLQVSLPNGKKGLRETNTMPQWAGSCWYYLRFLDPKNAEKPWSEELEKYWMPVDLYIGGVEHAVLHLLYARFWHKVLYDLGYVHTKEPFQKLFNQGMILGQSFRDERGKFYERSQVEEKNSQFFLKGTSEPIQSQIEKMSKSRLNVVNTDDVITQYGADSMRLYELFMGPLEAVKPWNTDGVEGVFRFLGRVWRLVVDERTGNINPRVGDFPPESQMNLWKSLHKTVRKVTEDTALLKFNTAISQMMIFVNEATSASQLPKSQMSLFLRTLYPYAPHIAEELWWRLGEKGRVYQTEWPKFDPRLCEEATVTVVIQINGKIRDKIDVDKGLSRERLEALAREAPKTKVALAETPAKKVIVVPDRLVNFVV